MTPIEQLNDLQQNQTNAFFGAFNIAISGIEKFTQLQLNAAKAAADELAGHAQTLLQAKDPQSYNEINTSAIQPAIEKLTSYSRHIAEIAVSTQQALVNEVEKQLETTNKTVAAQVDKASKQAPAGTESLFGAIKAGLANSNSAYSSLTKTAKQNRDLMEANLANITDTFVKQTNATSKGKKAA
jgi:phasin family protein